MYLIYRNNRKELISTSEVLSDLNLETEEFTDTGANWDTLGKLETKRFTIISSNVNLVITNSINGQKGYLLIVQNGTGGHNYNVPLNRYGNFYVDKRPNAITLLTYLFDGFNYFWDSLTDPDDTYLRGTIFDHYLHDGSTPTFMSSIIFNSASSYAVVNTSVNMGIARFDTGIDANGIAGNGYNNAQPLVLGGSAYSIRCVFRIPTLANNTDSFFVAIGFSDVFRGTASTTDNTVDGVYLFYSQANNTFRYITRNNSTSTNQNSNITVVANTFYELNIRVNKAATQAVFSINNGSPTTISSNIPSTTARSTGIIAAIAKTLGTAARTLDLDYFQFTYDRT